MKIEANPQNRAGGIALEVYRRTIEWARGDNLVREAIWVDGETLVADYVVLNLADYDRIIVAGAGKASVAMAQGVEDILGDRIHSGLIVTKYGHSEPLKKCRIIEAGHPVPDENSLKAGEEMLALAESVTDRDLVIFLISGGASALMEAPHEGISLNDLILVNQLLLDSGVRIDEMNAVRSRLSRLKAGGLAVAFQKATVLVPYISDVEGDNVIYIGSGPFSASATHDKLPSILSAYGLDSKLPPHVRERILTKHYQGGSTLWCPHLMVGSSQMLREMAVKVAGEMGLRCTSFPTMSGEARDYPQMLAKKRLFPKALRFGDPACALAVGEAVVHRQGQGLGGRAQEMALSFAELVKGQEGVAVLVAGSDGTDGPTDAAGALVDGTTIDRALAKGFSVEETMANSNSYHFHEAAGTLVKTGATGTNVSDLLIVVRT